MTFLLFGTTWFWLWITVAVGYIIWTVEKDDYNPVGATVVFLVAMTGLFIFGNKGSFIEMFEWIIQNPGYTLLAIISYIVLGVAWSFVKWFTYLKQMKQRKTRIYGVEIDFDCNKGRIVSWMCYWPLSALWTLINDPVRKLYTRICETLAGAYQKMADRMIKIEKEDR